MKLVETGRENFNNNGFMNGVTDCNPTEYFSHALSNTANQGNVNARVLVKKSGMVKRLKTY